MGWVEEAVECFETAIEINPLYALAWYNKGITLLKLNHDTEARVALARARDLGFS